MNPDLQQQLAELLKKLLGAMESGAAFAADQIPPLVQEKIMLGRVTETAWLCMAFVMLIALWLFSKRLLWANLARWEKEADADTKGIPTVLVVGSTLIPGGLLLAILLEQFEHFALVWFAPRLYIVEWLKGLVTS